MRHTLINPNQFRHLGTKVQDKPYHEDCPMSIESPNSEFAACLQSVLTVMFLDTWFPIKGDLNSYPHIELTSHRHWNPHKKLSFNKKILCARGGIGAECLEENNMLLRVYKQRYISPTRWGYQRWLQKSQWGGSCLCRHGRLPQASFIWRRCHRDTCVRYIDCK